MVDLFSLLIDLVQQASNDVNQGYISSMYLKYGAAVLLMLQSFFILRTRASMGSSVCWSVRLFVGNIKLQNFN